MSAAPLARQFRTLRRDTPDGPAPLHYEVVDGTGGDGPWLPLLHGWPESGEMWEPVVPALAARFRLILPDQRGAGLSGRPAAGYDVATLADDLAAVLADAGVEGPTAVVGHDVGGMVATAYALSQPHRVSRLAVIESPPPGLTADGWEEVKAGFWHFGLFAEPDLPEALIGGRERAFLAWFMRRYAGRRQAVPLDVTNARADALAADGGLRATLGVYRAMPTSARQVQDLTRANRLTMPVLGLGGAVCLGDWVGKLLATVGDDVTTETVPGCGHWVVAERPDWLADRLLGFLTA